MLFLVWQAKRYKFLKTKINQLLSIWPLTPPAGTIMTPNYISNSSADVSLWCNCEGSGNQWPDCLKLQHLFTDNRCLREYPCLHMLCRLILDWVRLFLIQPRFHQHNSVLAMSSFCTFGFQNRTFWGKKKAVGERWKFTKHSICLRQLWWKSCF